MWLTDKVTEAPKVIETEGVLGTCVCVCVCVCVCDKGVFTLTSRGKIRTGKSMV